MFKWDKNILCEKVLLVFRKKRFTFSQEKSIIWDRKLCPFSGEERRPFTKVTYIRLYSNAAGTGSFVRAMEMSVKLRVRLTKSGL